MELGIDFRHILRKLKPDTLYVDRRGPNVEVQALDVEVTPENPLLIPLTIEKVPLPPLRDSMTIGRTVVDMQSREMRALLAEAKAMQSVSEEQRPRQLLELLNSRVKYGERVALNTTTQVLQRGTGNCEDLTTLFILLAQASGMKATYESNVANGPIRNVSRYGTNALLFSDLPLASPLDVGHAWAEVKMSKGPWVAVDPSTQLVGDEYHDRVTLRTANYRASVFNSLNVLSNKPAHTHWKRQTEDLEPSVGGNGCSGILKLFQDKLYRGPLNLRISPNILINQNWIKSIPIAFPKIQVPVK